MAAAIAPREKVSSSVAASTGTRRRAKNARPGLLPRARCHVGASEDAQPGKQPERVPVGERIAEPVVGHVGRDRPDVGGHSGDQRDRAYGHRGHGQPGGHQPEVANRVGERAEEDQQQQVQQSAIELHQRAGRRIRPLCGRQRPDRVQREQADRGGGGGADAAERPFGHRHPNCEDQRHDKRCQGGVTDEEPARVDAQVDNQSAGQKHEAGLGHPVDLMHLSKYSPAEPSYVPYYGAGPMARPITPGSTGLTGMATQ